MRHITAILLFFAGLFTLSAQEFEVASFEIDPSDLTARVQSRVDKNGRKCALLKVYVPDEITQAQGNVFGDIVNNGMEKLVYLTHDTKKVKLLFAKHYPIEIVFNDFNFPTVSEQMVYVVKLKETGSSGTLAPVVQKPSTPQVNIADIEDQIIQTYHDGYYQKCFDLAMQYQDNHVAQNTIGLIYEYGHLGKKDYTEAVRWYRKAAEQGYDVAQSNLGLCYENGRGVSVDYSEAVKWYRKAAEQGYAPAQSNLGTCYYFGEGVNVDYNEAIRWYRKAAEQGEANAQNNLGVCYENGQGVDKDLTEAVKWYRKAAENGNNKAKEILKRLGY